MTAALVFLGAVVGAPLRYLTDRVVQSRHDSLFPWGTFTFIVNLVGSLVLGALTGAATALPQPVLVLVGTGFCGALTTYSTFSYETLRLAEQKAYFYAAMNVTVSVIAGIGTALLAYTTTSASSADDPYAAVHAARPAGARTLRRPSRRPCTRHRLPVADQAWQAATWPLRCRCVGVPLVTTCSGGTSFVTTVPAAT